MTRKFMSPLWLSIMLVVFYCVVGAIISLIVAAIMKKENTQLQQPQ